MKIEKCKVTNISMLIKSNITLGFAKRISFIDCKTKKSLFCWADTTYDNYNFWGSLKEGDILTNVTLLKSKKYNSNNIIDCKKLPCIATS